jgi:hypothetical protein
MAKERQINSVEEKRLVESLQKVIEDWWGDTSSEPWLKSCPWAGERLLNLMARAAVNILLAAKDVEVYLIDEGYLTYDS